MLAVCKFRKLCKSDFCKLCKVFVIFVSFVSPTFVSLVSLVSASCPFCGALAPKALALAVETMKADAAKMESLFIIGLFVLFIVFKEIVVF